MNNKEELIVLAASKVHEDWCIQELKGFWERAKEIKNKNKEELTNGVVKEENNTFINKVKNKFKKTEQPIEIRELTPREILEKACYKNGNKRNEISIDVDFILGHESTAESSLTNFDDFLWIVKHGGYNIKRFTKRELTSEELVKMDEHYKKETGEENILRPFVNLSSESKKENLEAAIGAYNVFEQMSKAGITIEQMTKDTEILNIIGVAIHTDWLKRNIDHPNESLKVPYEDLDNWTQEQDLVVFAALLNVVKQNKDKYLIEPIEGYQLPNYHEEEQQLLGIKTQTYTK